MASRNSKTDGARAALVVDDQKDICYSLGLALERLGYSCLLAGNGDEAIKLFLANEDTIVLIVLDLRMPGMNGRELLHAIRARGSEVAIVLSSGEPEAVVATVASEGADAYLLKPYDMQELADTIAKAIAQRA